jgi:hypothetical protein
MEPTYPDQIRLVDDSLSVDKEDRPVDQEAVHEVQSNASEEQETND